MTNILQFIAKQTDGINYSSFKYCLDATGSVPRMDYDDKPEINVSKKGETDKSIKTWRSVERMVRQVTETHNPLFRFFLDGSRRTYKIDDIAYGARLYPVVAGQIGIGVCERHNPDTFKPVLLKNPLVISIPDCANSVSKDDEVFFNNLIGKINGLESLKKMGIAFDKVLPYDSKPPKQGEKYEHKGVATIQDYMVDLEKLAVKQLAKQGKLNMESYLLKDGSLEYQKMSSGELRDLSRIKSNYASVVGVSKAFNPESLMKYERNIGRTIAELPEYHRTPAFMYETPRIPDVRFCVWYLRIRKSIASPYDGVVKIEKVLVWDDEEENGLDSDEVDLISANVILERNPVCYGQDTRWTKHLYPVFLTEKFIKSKYLSDVLFTNLF